jgi:hypothetical protein
MDQSTTTTMSWKGKIIFALAFLTLFFYGLSSNAQVTTPDTVCAGATDVVYGVVNSSATSQYYWGVTDSTLAAIDTTIVPNDSIVHVDFADTTGDLLIWVYEINEFGCIGDTVFLDIHIREPFVATMDSMIVCDGDSAFITVDFSGGTAPWVFEYTDGTNTVTDTAYTNPHIIHFGTQSNTTGSPVVTTIEMLSVYDNSGCPVFPDDLPATTFTINPRPVTQGIFHF